ncbi:hypothetical protein [Magnetospirillum sulfuroxidans]|uniref:Uncharacterized protein n=1 Tax=Magnetospirillum sulfuroxidans TaxID=611300 RepID=A0ABS5I8X2_9PROT|nr:hypothetical protein [Magnetospirillum sulfuroxidans]MBR9970892.1 hypothetical protein [Magnetospirillum sulfuroxidans]
MGKRQFFTETCLGFCSRGLLAVNPAHIERIEDQPEEARQLARDCHIYLICRRPSLTLKPGSISLGDGVCRGVIIINELGRMREVSFKLNGIPDNFHCMKESAYPYKKIEAFDVGGDLLWSALINMALPMMVLADNSIRNLEVCYVGQAYGDGTRSAADRLKSHSTLQKVLADSAMERPDLEVVLLMFQYEQQVFFSFDGRSSDAPPPEADGNRIGDTLDGVPLDEKKTIAIVEAGLIRYFRPEYNIKLRDWYPKEGQKLLDECYELDFSGLIVEINTENAASPIYSSSRAPGIHHIANFDLHDPEVRRSFFAMMEGMPTDMATKTSGPIY